VELRIDFYGKEKVAIQMGFSGRYPFPENEISELFLFTCFTLRQLQNLGQHPVPQALAGFLVSDTCISKVFQNNLVLPKGAELISTLRYHAVAVVTKSKGPEASYSVNKMLSKEMEYNDSIMEALDRNIITKVPKLVEYSGKGDKSFEVTLPPFWLKMNGFGIFSQDTSHHSFHSVISLIRFLTLKHPNDQNYQDHLIAAAKNCGTAYVFKLITGDQVALAKQIVDSLGIS
jgi:hypothetical protein